MHSYYILPILVILFQGGTTLDIDSELSTFAKLCLFPKSPVKLNISTLIPTEDEKSENPFTAVIGSKVMQQKLSQFLTEKTEKVPSEELDKMCLTTIVKSVDEHGMSFGNFFGFENHNASYVCKTSKDFPGIELCNYATASKKFDEDAIAFFDTANEDAILEIDCFKSGKVGWVLYSQNPSKITEEQKKSYFARANALGFPEDTNVDMYNEKCAVHV